MTKIEWTDKTWNPVTGCTKVSPGCQNCYAERMSKRFAGRFGYPEAPHSFDVTLHHDRLEQPLRWKKPRMIFVCSMSDLFHEDVPFEYIWRIWTVMQDAYRHTFQVLTKGPQRAARVLERIQKSDRFRQPSLWPVPNVWLGVTAENQAMADKRIPILLQTPAAVHFVSCEPLLGAIDFNRDYTPPPHPITGQTVTYPWLDCWGLDWVIVGGETGPGARPMHPDWARSLRDQCQEAGVAFFFKQAIIKGKRIHTLDGLEYKEFPSA